MVRVICYNRAKDWMNREDAIVFYSEAVLGCDGSEKARYATILGKLLAGCMECSDDGDE